MLRHVGDEEALIVPVPLHRWRLWHRGFNQSALIADHLGRLTGWPVEKMALRRVKRTAPLRGMNPAQRTKAVRGAFALADASAIKGRRVLLIDDVHTSGATAAACARVLRRGGAAEVRLLCWARVLPDADVE
jgi:ComF family protein